MCDNFFGIFILIFDELYPHELDQHFKVVENYVVETITRFYKET